MDLAIIIEEGNLMKNERLKGLFLLEERAFQLIYCPTIRQQIEELVEIIAPPQTGPSIETRPEILAEVQVLFSGWGCPVLSEELLNHAPNLTAVFYGAGSIRYLVSDAFWNRNILISTAYEANDIPVSEYTLAQIILSLKRYWQHVQSVKAGSRWWGHLTVPGTYHSTVGLISLGMIGSLVAEKLKMLEVNVIAYDPFITESKARELGVELKGLEEVFQQADVISLHTPWLPETVGMITGKHLASMKEGATFINTARGAIVKEQELIAVLAQRPDLYALLDVTWPEPPEPESPLFKLPNVVISPHIAGSMDQECQRNGQYVLDELKRYLAGEPLRFAVNRQSMAIMA